LEKNLIDRFIKAEKTDPLKILAEELFIEGWTEEKLAKEDHHTVPDPIYWKVRNHLRYLEKKEEIF
jgi:hypothetical protein